MEAPVIIPNQDEHRASVIWLHGLGADGNDFAPLVPELKLPHQAHIKFIFPHAPVRPVTLNWGMPMRAWFDIQEVTLEADIDEQEVDEAYRDIAQLIDQEIQAGIHSTNIVIAGFSQGGSLALVTALRYPQPLGALIGLSTYLPHHPLIDHYAQSAHQPRVFLAHGNQDTTVPLNMGEHTRDQLQNYGFEVEWHSYQMPHSVCPQEVADISHFLQDLGK